MALWSSEVPSVKQSGRRVRLSRPPQAPPNFFCFVVKSMQETKAGSSNFQFKVSGRTEGVEFGATGLIQERFPCSQH